MTSVATQPGWRGSFSPVAFTNVLKRVADEGRSGELQIVSGNWIKTIRVDEGAVRFARSNMRQDRLGESMLAHDSISRSEYRLASERMAHDGCRFGEALLKMGRLDRQQLHRELGVQVQRIVLSLFRMSEGLYSFEEADSNDTRLPFSLSVPPLLLKGLRRIEDRRLILSALPAADTVVRIAPRPAYSFDLAKLAPMERSVLERAGDGASIGSIVRDPSLERSAAMRACYALLTLGLLELAPRAQESASDTDEPTRELILTQFERHEHAVAEALLGVDRDASSEQLREAYEGLRGEWAEVRAETRDASLLEKIERIEFRLAAAYHQLLVENTSSPEAASEEPAAAAEDGDNAMHRSRIEQLDRDAKLHMQVKDWSGAISLLHELVALVPEEASYQLMLGHALQFHPTLAKTAEEHFLQALELAPDDAAVHAALGRYYQRTKQPPRAIAAFERVLQIDPANEDAKRYLATGRKPSRMKKWLRTIFK